MASSLRQRTLFRTPLLFSQQPSTVCLRELHGWDEQSIQNTNEGALLDFLDRLLLHLQDTDLEPGEAVQLPLPDRDRILSELYLHTFGDSIQSTLICRECGSHFDLQFPLRELLKDLYGSIPSSPTRAHIGSVVEDEHGNKIRVPTGKDERKMAEFPPEGSEERLAESCRITGDPDVGSKQLQRILSEKAPLVDRVLKATCPECSRSRSARFAIQPFLLTRINQEQSRLTREVDQLAYAYGWEFKQIMDLPRSWRKQLVDRIDSSSRASRRRVRS